MVSSPEETGVLPVGFLTERDIEPVGRWFLTQWERLNSNRTISTGILSDSSDDEEDEQEEELFDDDLEYLRSLDPKEVKEQDHYRVLGLSNLRIVATDDQIKRAHRQKVLRHHPDKRKAAGEDIKEDDDYFTCITKAFETLGNPVKRRAFDSVDPLYDDDVPDVLKKDGKDFYKTFCPVFQMNERWSNKTPVPKLGDINSSRSDVENFYSFWYEFDSWREYSYEDEEDKEKASDKWERREIEKINKAQRAEKKKEEGKRIRRLVDNAYNSDPRIVAFRKAEFQEKAAKRKAKADAIKARKEEEERLIREAEEKVKREKEEAERIEKQKQEVEKKEREANKKLIKNERKRLRALAKDHDMFAETESEKVFHLSEMEKICEIYTIEKLRDLNTRLAENATARTVFLQELEKINAQLQKERNMGTEQSRGGASTEKSTSNGREWSNDDLQLLIKAVNLFPAGTAQRWEVVANFINQHTKEQGTRRYAKETLSKAKDLQSGSMAMSSLKEEVNKMAYQNLQKGQKRDVVVESEASQRTETPAEALGFSSAPWTADEQKLLEQALKTYPASTPERWERISESIPGRGKKDCMKRYKELAELIRAKKAAQAAAANKL